MNAAVTGASGFIGGYLVRELVRHGHHVTVLGRSESSLLHLRRHGVTVFAGNLLDLGSLRRFCKGQDCIFHGAAIVSGYGSWSRFYETGVLGTENLINAAVAEGVERFIHISSLTVYGSRPASLPVKESTPIDQHVNNWNYYVRQKILSERVVWNAYDKRRVLVTIFRPSLVLGPGDRNVVAKTLRYIRSPFAAIIGDGQNHVACVIVDEVVHVIVKSVTLQTAIGKAYNLSGSDSVTQVKFLDFHALAAGLPRVRRRIPIKFAKVSSAIFEYVYKLAGFEREPFCTRIGVELMAEHLDVDCSLATHDLGWEGIGDYERAIRLSVEWYLKNQDHVDPTTETKL